VAWPGAMAVEEDVLGAGDWEDGGCELEGYPAVVDERGEPLNVDGRCDKLIVLLAEVATAETVLLCADEAGTTPPAEDADADDDEDEDQSVDWPLDKPSAGFMLLFGSTNGEMVFGRFTKALL
jgi:hypothetical protein